MLRTLLVLVFLSSAVAVLTRNRSIQTSIARYLTQKFATITGSDIHIGSVEIDFLRNFHLEDLVIYDLHHDTLLSLKSLDFRLNEIDFPESKAMITKVTLNHGLIKMGQYQSDSLLNYEMILSKLSSDTSSGAPWQFNVRDISLIGTDYVFFNGNNPEKSSIKGEFNPNYIRVNQLTGNISELGVYKNGKFTFNVQTLKGKERSGFPIEELATKGEFYQKKLELNELKLYTGDTRIDGLFSMDWSANDAMLNFYKKVIFQVTVVSSPIRLSDIGPFAPWLKNHSITLLCDFTLKGPLSDLRSRDFTAVTSAGTELNLNYRLMGLPNVSKLVNVIQMNECVIEMTDAMEMFAGETWGGYLARFGTTYWNAALNIPLDSFVFNGLAQSDIGGYQGRFVLDYSNDKSLPYSVKGETKDLVLNGLASTMKDFGKFNSTLDIKGDGFDENAVAQFDVKISEFQFNQKSILNSTASGKLNHGKLELDVSSTDDNSKLTLDLIGENLFGVKKSLNAQLNLSKLNLRKLGFDTSNLDLAGKFNVSISGSNWDDLIGLISIQDARFHKGNDEYYLRNQLIQRPSLEYLGFKGDWADGSISGPLKFTHAPDWIKHMSNNLVPERFDDISFKLNDSCLLYTSDAADE